MLLAYVVGLIIYSLLPLDLSISPAKLWHKYREGQVQTIPFAAFDGTAEKWLDLAAGVLRFMPIGVFAVTAFAPADRPVRSLGQSLILALSITAGIELSQVFVVSRQSDATEFVCALVGVTWGAAWRRRKLRPPFEFGTA
jgi:glycopeptide antibiotics resistance protein